MGFDMADAKKAEEEKPKEGAEATPAEGAEGAAAGDADTAKKKKKKMIIIAAGGFVGLLIVLGVVAFFMGWLDGLLGRHPDCATVAEGDKGYEYCAEELKKQKEAESKPGLFIDVPDMIVNLSSTSKQPRFLKISVKIELTNKEDEAGFNEILPRVIDQFQSYLRELRIEDLRGSSGMYRLKLELLSRVRAVAPHIKVRDVLFQEILVQ